MSGFVEVLPPERTGPEHAEWFEVRAEGVTASEIGAIMGLSPYDSPFAVYWRKRGVMSEQDDQPHLRWGRRLEEYLAAEFAERHEEFGVALAGMYAHADRPWQMASPDRLIYETERYGDFLAAPWDYPRDLERDEYPAPVGVLEAKTSGSWDGWGEDGSDQIPLHYRCQVQWQMDVLGVPVAYLPVAVGRTYREYVVSYDPDDAKLMREVAETFMDRVRRNDPPDVDALPATLDTLRRLHPDVDDETVTVPHHLAMKYRAACRSYAKAKDRKKLLENQLRQRMGRARVACDPDGDKVTTRTVYEVKEHIRRASRVDKLVPAKEAS